MKKNKQLLPQRSDEALAQDGIKELKIDGNVFFINDKKLKKELNKYINRLYGKPW